MSHGLLVQSLSHVRFFATLWVAACQASLSSLPGLITGHFKTFYKTLGYKDENATEMANYFEIIACILSTCELKPNQNSDNAIYHHNLFIRKQR